MLCKAEEIGRGLGKKYLYATTSNPAAIESYKKAGWAFLGRTKSRGHKFIVSIINGWSKYYGNANKRTG